MMNLRRTLSLIPAVLLAAVGHAQSGPAPDLPPVVPLHQMKVGQWVEMVWGDPEKPGEIFAIRIHNDAGYIAMPHVHPMDEHVVVVQGAWWFAMGSRFEPSALKEVKLGDFTIGPKNMPHFGWAKVETTIHVYGIGPFRSTLIDPVYELTSEGTFLLTSLLRPGTPTNSGPSDCFALKVGAHVKSAEAEGTVVGARCSPANHITQYWIEKSDGRRFWVRLEELKTPDKPRKSP
jgi:quercetin dioxygenase-like cupin family protein